jgi:DNA-binding GntR family transcriptional regulator
VSRIPVREALRQLEAEGLVSFHPHRGAVVSSLSLAEIEEVFSLRANIETGLLRAAVPLLGEEHLGQAHEVLRRYDRALRAKNVVAYGELNWQFHSTLYAPADRPVTMGIVQRLHRQADRYLRMQLVLTHSEHRSREEHHAILDAAGDGDAKSAVALLRDHIMSAGRVLVRFLRAQRDAVAEPPRRPSRARATARGAAGRE